MSSIAKVCKPWISISCLHESDSPDSIVPLNHRRRFVTLGSHGCHHCFRLCLPICVCCYFMCHVHMPMSEWISKLHCPGTFQIAYPLSLRPKGIHTRTSSVNANASRCSAYTTQEAARLHVRQFCCRRWQFVSRWASGGGPCWFSRPAADLHLLQIHLFMAARPQKGHPPPPPQISFLGIASSCHSDTVLPHLQRHEYRMQFV